MFSMAFSSKDCFTYSSYSRLIRTNYLFSVKISYFHEYTLSMAFSSKDISSDSSHIQVIPKHISKVGNPNLSNINSLLPNNKKGNINDNIGVSAPLKHFTYPSEHPTNFNDDIHIKHAKKLEVIKHILIKLGDDDSFEGLAMIDVVQRLGIDYYFQDEIELILRRQYSIFFTDGDRYNDLQEVALRFRLLRQQGYYVSADVFNRFRNKEGEFKQNISEDINGLMSLYEASQLSIGGEDGLDEAGHFSATHLANYDLAGVVEHLLLHPYRKSLSPAKNFFHGNFQGSEYIWILDLQELANMDFKLVQSLHQKEIVQISSWWRELGLAKKLEFAREQPVKWYVWSMACFTDPNLSWQRIELTKPISFVYIIDDIFDVCGALDALTLFTEAINRWDLGDIDQLPEYMKICFKALNDITNEISNKVYKEHGYNPVHSLRKAWGSLCNAFLIEAKWFASGHLPKAEEYLENGIVSSGVHLVLVHIFFLLGHGITNETVQLIDSNPPIVSSVATILRIWDDLGSAKDENQGGKDGSYIYYYMMEHRDLTAEDAHKHAMDKISDAWKRLNKECLSPNPFSASFTRASLNCARMVPLMYSYDDSQRLPSLEEYIKSSLFDNLPTQGVY
ncbi:(3S,6E)-nerolidol synthase 1-like isoform X1 [Citrus sinensis]|uniref:(3S,6E)-nerolidol synthase 1-like isoform X1 n=1 Tax=Citrus sinensis TaxID=2711 RepID=UPI002278FD10|nr:(3S,6E)-nerolidol synthase 1-like isoform X1 [Citrus sinensis]